MKILMLINSLDIGGAETHVVSLSKELKRRGHEIYVISGAGAYESELANNGIHHIKIKKITRNPFSFLPVIRAIRKTVKNNEINIIHSHTRIMSLLSLIAHTGVPIVTTAHWVFSLGFPQRLLSYWGKKTLAVSPDIKNYLIDGYRLYPDAVTTTVNGIDTDIFSRKLLPNKKKHTFSSSEYKEKSNSENHFEILHVSRLDSGRSLCAYTLISIAEKLKKSIRGMHITIVGDGEKFARLATLAKRINEHEGREIITTVGASTKVEEYMKCADVFVGVSRAALEAMSCECEVILAGDEGYGSILKTNDIKKYIKTNFCCRDMPKTTADSMYRDIMLLYSKGCDERKICGMKNREVAEKSFSVAVMANDAEKVYGDIYTPCVKKAKVKSEKKSDDSAGKSALICGYYGYDNFGDDASMYAVVGELRKCGIYDITILCKKRKKVSSMLPVKTINRYNLAKIRRVLKKTDIFVFGGGNLLQNETSNHSLLYYQYVIKIAKDAGCTMICISSGVGNIIGKRAYKAATDSLSLFDAVLMRTPCDRNAGAMMSKKHNIFLSYDITKEIRLPDMSYYADRINRFLHADLPYMVVCPAKEVSKNDIDSVSSVAALTGLAVFIIPLFPVQDTDICREIYRKIKNSYMPKSVSVYEGLYLIKHAKLAVCGRFHGAMCAVYNNVPLLLIGRKDNVKLNRLYLSLLCESDSEKTKDKKSCKGNRTIYCDDISTADEQEVIDAVAE